MTNHAIYGKWLLEGYQAGAATPRWNPAARGTLAGLTFAHDRSCMARAFMEGITLDMRDMLRSMIDAGIEISAIRILGGTTRSPLWNQMQADMYDRPVETLKTTDAAIVGAAIFAGVGSGVFSDIGEGVGQMVTADQKYEPIPENVKIYAELSDVFCRMYEGLNEKVVFDSLARFQEKS